MLSRRPRRGGGHPIGETSEVMVAETCGLQERLALHNTLSSTNAAFQTALCSGLRSGRRRHIQRVSGDCGTHPLPSLPYQRGNNVPTFGPSPCRSERPKFLRSGLYRRGGVPGERTFEGLRRLLQRRRAVYSVRTAGKSVAGAMLIVTIAVAERSRALANISGQPLSVSQILQVP